ncbi:DUF4249 family protein [uncultured Draconibacterium sp.]|uniref:DUF4249 family protein n=1 Tax=uncultured Draconibacterium sp. TaxID=1573823 RepID=UPI0032177F02
MKRKFLILLFVIVLNVVFISCRKEIQIDFPELEIKPVVNCLFTDKTPMTVQLSLLKHANDTLDNFVNNAEVLVFSNNQLVTKLALTSKGLYSNSQFTPEKGKIYQLTVDIPGYKLVRASGSIPDNNIKVISIQSKSGYRYEAVTGTGEEPTVPVEDITVTLNEDEEKPDFFGFSFIQNRVDHYYNNDVLQLIEYEDEYSFGWYFRSEDVKVISEGVNNYDVESSILLFRDVGFQSSIDKVRFYIKKEIKSKYWGRLFIFSPEAYQYVHTWIIHDYTKYYDFWEVYEALPLYSNIENGYGIFAGYTTQQYEITPDSTQTYQ